MTASDKWERDEFAEDLYNPRTGEFWCTECYIMGGQPLGVA